MIIKMVSLENLNKAVKEVYKDNYKVRISTIEDIEERNKSKILYIADKQIEDAAIVLGDLLYRNDIDIKMYMYYINTFNIDNEQYVRLKDIDSYLQRCVESKKVELELKL